MKVLVLTSLFPEYPGEKNGNFVHDQVCALAGRGVSLDVLVAKPWQPHFTRQQWTNGDAEAPPAFNLHKARFFSLPRNALGSWAVPAATLCLRRHIQALIDERRIDVIHAHEPKMAHAAVSAAQELGVPVVVTIHGVAVGGLAPETAAKCVQLRRIFDRVTRVILVGTPLREYCLKFVTPHKLEIISNGFQIPIGVSPSQRVPRISKVRIITAANLDPNKGIDYLLRAVSVLRCDFSASLDLVVVGDGPERSRLGRLVRELGLAEAVRFTGQLSHPETIAEIAAADVFCLPSWREACGLVYMEAMALGKPTVGCAGQGPADLMVDGVSGFLAEPRSVLDLTRALLDIIEHPRRAQEIADRGKRHAWANLTWERHATKLLRVYEQAVNDVPRPSTGSAHVSTSECRSHAH